MEKIRSSILVLSLIFASGIYAEDAKKEEAKPEEAKKEEVKKEEPKKEEAKKKPAVAAHPKECFYSAHALALVDNAKFDDEVKKIQEKFEKCEQSLAKQKEFEIKAKECRALNHQVKEKRMSILKLTAESAKMNKKDDFEKLVTSVKTAKEELTSFENKFRETCRATKKEEPKKEEPKKEEVKKEEPKKEEPKKEEVKKEEPKKEEVKKEEPKKEEPKKEEVKK